MNLFYLKSIFTTTSAYKACHINITSTISDDHCDNTQLNIAVELVEGHLALLFLLLLITPLVNYQNIK